MPQANHCNIAIIGGSFAGLSAYLVLRKRLGKDVNIKIFDMRTHFTYIPGLHECIANTKRLESLQFSFSKYYKEDYIHGEIDHITDCHDLLLKNGDTRSFDYALVATGSRPQFYDNDDWKKYGYTRRYAEDVEKFNHKLETSKTIAVIGGGITGVELSTMLKARCPEKKIHLIHSRHTVLDHMQDKATTYIDEYMKKQGIIRHYGKRLEGVQPTYITLNDGTRIDVDLALISAGVTADDTPHKKHLTFADDYLCVESESIYIAGDVAMHGLLPTAHNAMIEGRRMGHLIADKVQGNTKTYPPIENWTTLAIAMGEHDGYFAIDTGGFPFPKITALAKRLIEKRVMFEFKHKILLPV